jgi:hypothetical protein
MELAKRPRSRPGEAPAKPSATKAVAVEAVAMEGIAVETGSS